MNVYRRDIIKFMGALIALPTAAKIIGCGEEKGDTGDEGESLVNAQWEADAAGLEEVRIFSAADPGEWEGKEGSHVAQLTVDGETATALTTHGMEEDHWVDVIYVRNQDDVVIAYQTFLGTDAEANFDFTIPEGTTSLTAYAHCNLHGLWIAESVAV